VNKFVEYQIKKYKINLLVFLSVTLVVAILSIIIFNSKEFHQDQYKTSLFLKNGVIYVEGESFPFTGRMLDTLDNKMMVEFDVVNGLKNGEFFLYSVSGKLKAYGYMENNKNIGPWEYFYDNGQLECTGEFKNDKPIGKWFWYYENGVRKCEGIYLNGVPEGNWMKYDNDGYPGLLINYYSGEIISIVEIYKPKMI
jgi:antitoxin component YwqK of YwqJK toxin-antitoxin module